MARRLTSYDTGYGARWDWPKCSDRQFYVLLVMILGFLIGIPAVVLLGSAFVAGWLSVLGVHGVHGIVFGWLSTENHDKQGHPIWGVGRVVPIYILGVITAYLIYQICEAAAIVFEKFKEALS